VFEPTASVIVAGSPVLLSSSFQYETNPAVLSICDWYVKSVVSVEAAADNEVEDNVFIGPTTALPVDVGSTSRPSAGPAGDLTSTVEWVLPPRRRPAGRPVTNDTPHTNDNSAAHAANRLARRIEGVGWKIADTRHPRNAD